MTGHTPTSGSFARGVGGGGPPINESGQIVIVLDWTAATTPPTDAKLKISSKVDTMSAATTGSVDLQARDLFATPTEPISGANSPSLRSMSSRLITVPNPSRLNRIELSGYSLLAVAVSNTARQVKLEAQIVNDTRSVEISNSAIEPSYGRTMDTSFSSTKYRNGQLPVPFQAPMINEIGAGLLNERRGDGSMVVDSVATWDSSSQQWMAHGVYQAHVPNFINPTFKWTWAGGSQIGNAQEKLDFATSTLDMTPSTGVFLHGMMLGGDAAGVGMTTESTVNVTATDTDGAVGKNTYTINWHRPYEKIKDLSDGNRRKDPYWMSTEPLTDGGSVSVVEVPAKEFDLLAAIDDVSVIASEVGLPTEQIESLIAVYKALTNILDWKETTPAVSTLSSGIVHDDFTFRAAVRERPENIEGMTVAKRDEWISLMDTPPQDDLERFLANYDCYAARVRYHHAKRVLADKYDIHGFHSPNYVLSWDKTEKYAWETWYQLKRATPVPPALGDREIPPSYNSA